MSVVKYLNDISAGYTDPSPGVSGEVKKAKPQTHLLSAAYTPNQACSALGQESWIVLLSWLRVCVSGVVQFL